MHSACIISFKHFFKTYEKRISGNCWTNACIIYIKRSLWCTFFLWLLHIYTALLTINMPFSGCWLQINSLSNFVAEVYRIMPFFFLYIFPCVSSNNIYSDKSTLKDVKMKYILRIHKQAICFLQMSLFTQIIHLLINT